MPVRPKAIRDPNGHGVLGADASIHLLGRAPSDSAEEAAVARLEWRLFFEPRLLAQAVAAPQATCRLADAGARFRRPLLVAALSLAALWSGSALASPPIVMSRSAGAEGPTLERIATSIDAWGRAIRLPGGSYDPTECPLDFGCG